MWHMFLDHWIPIVIPIVFLSIGLYLTIAKDFNQTKVFMIIGPLIGLILGLNIAFAFGMSMLTRVIIIGAFIIFASIFTLPLVVRIGGRMENNDQS
ncbi:hypothetical protein [Thalassobacillus hwangdonensis]|uniref:YesK-like protein n=1 Tax=Thalassobacillus hwangdonensis TaxID=546108 RepID=A0ABW3KWZ9_9BACI